MTHHQWQSVEDVMGLSEGQVQSLTLLLVRYLSMFVQPSFSSTAQTSSSSTASSTSSITPFSSRDEDEFDGKLAKLMQLMEVWCGDKRHKLMAVRLTLEQLNTLHRAKTPHLSTTPISPEACVVQAMLCHLYIKLPHLFDTPISNPNFSSLSTQVLPSLFYLLLIFKLTNGRCTI